MTATLDLLDAQVEAFGGAVAGAGVVVGEDLTAPRFKVLPSDWIVGVPRSGVGRGEPDWFVVAGCRFCQAGIARVTSSVVSGVGWWSLAIDSSER